MDRVRQLQSEWSKVALLKVTVVVDDDENEEETEDTVAFSAGTTFAPKDIDTTIFSSKKDAHGLGYKVEASVSCNS